MFSCSTTAFSIKTSARFTALSPDDLPLNQKWSWDKILRSPFIKQADVLQGVYFFGDRYDIDTKRRNFEFYEPMTVHESFAFGLGARHFGGRIG